MHTSINRLCKYVVYKHHLSDKINVNKYIRVRRTILRVRYILKNMLTVIFLLLLVIGATDTSFHPVQDLAVYLKALRTIFDPNRECIFLCDASCPLGGSQARVFYDIVPKIPTASVNSCIDHLSNYYQSRCVRSTVNCSFTTALDAHCTYEIEGRQMNTNSDPCLLLAFNNTYVTSCDQTLLGQVFFGIFCKTPLG
jgi:hypothetical protein